MERELRNIYAAPRYSLHIAYYLYSCILATDAASHKPPGFLSLVYTCSTTGSPSPTAHSVHPAFTVASSNILQSLLPPGTNLTSALAHATRTIEQFFGVPQSSPSQPASWPQTLGTYINSAVEVFAERSAFENSAVVLGLCTFLVLIMSWTSRLGNLGRFSPFTRSPPQGSSRVSDSDFSYITADDLRKHQAEANKYSQQTVESPQEYGPPRDTDILVLRNKKKDFTVHFPAYSIPRGELTIGQVREQAGKKTNTADWRRVKLLYKGKNLKDDSRTCKQEGVREGAELMCTIADNIPSASASDDSEDDEFGGLDNDNGEGGARKKRNRGKKSKRKNKREQNSGTSTPLETGERLGVPPTTQRVPSPKPPGTPATPIEKLNALFATLHSFIPDCDKFKSNPPSEPAKRDFEHKRLSETILTQVLLKADGVEVEGDPEARMRRKELVKETQAILQSLDAAVKA